MNKPSTPDEVLAQIRAMPLVDREYIEAELMREAYEQRARSEPPELRAEIIRRAKHAIEHEGEGLTLEEAIAGARAAVASVRERKSRG